MKNLRYLLIGFALACGSVSGETIVQLAAQYSDRTVEEGYAGDIDQLQMGTQAGRDNSGNALLLAPDTTGLDPRNHYYQGEVIIADVRSSVYSDDDQDGFYTRFSLTFDVDTYSQYSDYEYVYARIYLSKDGTGYDLFHVTEVFEIYSNYSSDRYKVDSNLVSNFDAAYYDVKIEVFVAGATGVQDEVDAATHRSLFALPLESDRLDGNSNADFIVYEHAGSFSTPGLLILAVFGIVAIFSRAKAV